MVKIMLVEDETPKAKITVQHSIEDFDPIIKKAAEKYKIDPLLLKAQMLIESGGNAKIQGPEVGDKKERAGGLFQLMPGTAKDLGVTDVFDPEQNIDAGARYLRMQMDHPSAAGDLPTGLMFYHGGKDPKNWGQHSFAYPAKVLAKYRELGGREMDPAVPKFDGATGLAVRAAHAALPFDGFSRATYGKGPDLSQGLSGPEANRPVGAKLKDWFGSVSPERAQFQKSMANYADANPLLSIGADVVGGLPAGVVVGTGLNAGLGGLAKVAPQAVAPMLNFVAGQSGRGLPVTGEGASLSVRALSSAANGALQGGVLGAGNAYLQPGQTTGEGAATGALVGGVVGGALPLVGAAANRMIYGKRIPPETAQLGQELRAGRAEVPPVQLTPGMPSPSREALTGVPGKPAVPLTPSLDQANQLALDPQQFSRVVGEILDEPSPFKVTAGRLTRAREAIGEKIENALPDLYMAVDQDFVTGFRDLLAKAQQDPNLLAELKKLPALKKLSQDFSYAANMTDGMLSGADYQKLIQSGIKKKTPGLVTVLMKNSNPAVAEFGSELRSLMDEAVMRGTRESIEIALNRGDVAGAERVQKAFATFARAKQQWKMLDPIEKSLDPITQRVRPDKLYSGAEKVGGDLEQLARGALAFDPENLARHAPINIPYTAAAAGGGMVAQDPVTTGKAALLMVALNKLGRLGKAGIQQIPGYTSGMLARSSRFGPGPMESALRTIGLPAGVTAATGRNPLLQEQEPGLR